MQIRSRNLEPLRTLGPQLRCRRKRWRRASWANSRKLGRNQCPTGMLMQKL